MVDIFWRRIGFLLTKDHTKWSRFPCWVISWCSPRPPAGNNQCIIENCSATLEIISALLRIVQQHFRDFTQLSHLELILSITFVLKFLNFFVIVPHLFYLQLSRSRNAATVSLCVPAKAVPLILIRHCFIYNFKCKGKKVMVQLFMEHHLTATECHLPYGITQCYLLPDTSEHTPPSPQPVRPVLDLPTLEGGKAELTYAVGYITRWFTRPQMVTHAST